MAQPHIRIKESLMFLSANEWGLIDKEFKGVQCIQDMDVLCTFCFDKRSINAIVVYGCITSMTLWMRLAVIAITHLAKLKHEKNRFNKD
jgi:hypothetical protein